LFGLILHDRFCGVEETSDCTRDRFAQTLAVMLVMSVVSAFFYGSKGYISLSTCRRYLIPAIVGGMTGAALLDRIKLNWLKKIFAVIVIWAGIVMVT
jgi:uncharacterized membrane protein YfcA